MSACSYALHSVCPQFTFFLFVEPETIESRGEIDSMYDSMNVDNDELYTFTANATLIVGSYSITDNNKAEQPDMADMEGLKSFISLWRMATL